ncbi:MAG: dockerin type I domain-containing protein [Burkholderiales bacterium]
MKPLNQLRDRLLARADLNGDGKVDKTDIEVVIDQMKNALADDPVENAVIAMLCFVFGIVFAKVFL